MVIEQRLVHVQLIVTRSLQAEPERVRQLARLFSAQGAASGLVLLQPRSSPQARYRVAAQGEIVLAAQSAGLESVWALVGPWPDGLKPLVPDSGSVAGTTAVMDDAVAGFGQEPGALSPMARAQFYAEQIGRYGSQRRAARALGGIPRSRLNNAVQLLKLDGLVQQALQAGDICESAARTLALVADHGQQRRLLDWYLMELPRPTIRELEASVRTLAAQEGDPTANGKLVQRFCSSFSEQHGVRLQFAATGLGGWCSLDVADDDQGALLFARLLRVNPADRCRVSARKRGTLLRIRFHVESPTHLDQVLSAVLPECPPAPQQTWLGRRQARVFSCENGPGRGDG